MEKLDNLSRRAVLRSIGIIGLAAVLGREDKTALAQRLTPSGYQRWNGEPLARITEEFQVGYTEPTFTAGWVEKLPADAVVRVRRVVQGEALYPHNDVWLETNKGYLYASSVQPVRYHLPSVPTANLGAGKWAEVIVPYSESYYDADSTDLRRHAGRIYYRSVFRVVELMQGTDGFSWYRTEELDHDPVYVRATHLRLFSEEALSPLSLDVPPEEKRLEVDLKTQALTAYEYDQPVWAQLMSSGEFVDGKYTPEGEFAIYEKRPASRLLDLTTDDDPDIYNVPGVPFVCYFAVNGIATHGVYWHNDFGRAVSSGCINLTPDAARWVWRWTTPQSTGGELSVTTADGEVGTRVIVRG